MRHVFHPDADAEFADGVRHYADISPDLGARFYRDVERLVKEVCFFPELFRTFDPPARRHFSLEFPYAVIYVKQEEHVWIVAVMHMKRKPGYWRERLP